MARVEPQMSEPLRLLLKLEIIRRRWLWRGGLNEDDREARRQARVQFEESNPAFYKILIACEYVPYNHSHCERKDCHLFEGIWAARTYGVLEQRYAKGVLDSEAADQFFQKLTGVSVEDFQTKMKEIRDVI